MTHDAIAEPGAETDCEDASELRGIFLSSLAAARVETRPYRHWLLHDVLTDRACRAAAALPFAAPRIGDTLGKRETHNSTRVFYSAENRARFGACRNIAETLQEPGTVAALERACGVNLAGSFLRIEYCQDRDRFWLEPHTDIGAKLFTMLIYLSEGPETSGWGTDIFNRDGSHFATAPFEFNCGLIFVPGPDSWHGFRKRQFAGVRRSLIVNYVKDEWRARHELAFPDQPVTGTKP